jgi:peptidyl-tRNA hydrolase, PTH1 family
VDAESPAPRPVIVVGLGNPGRRYEGTRHNIGFVIADRVAEGMQGAERESLETAGVLRGTLEGRAVVIVWPTTFMNRSGEAIREVLERYEATPQDLLVVSDDVYLPLGALRIRLSGSDGGHNGLASVIQEVGTAEVPRLRVGVGQPDPPADLVEFVLGQFTDDERATLAALVDQAARCVLVYVAAGAPAAMNEFNGRATPTQM